jgi:hypothetical protein
VNARAFQQASDIAFLDRTRIVVREAVEADDVGAIGDELFRQRGSDEAGRAGDERLHVKSPLTRSGSRQGRPSRSIVHAVCGDQQLAVGGPHTS